MKKLLTGIILLASMSTFAESDFERGYYAGKDAAASTGSVVIGFLYFGERGFAVPKQELQEKCGDGTLSKITCEKRMNAAAHRMAICAALCIQK